MPTAAPGSAVQDPLVADLLAALPADRVLLDPDVVATFLHDEAEWAPHGRAAAVVRPRSTAEVAAVVAACARHGRPLVPRGAGTGLSGGANAVDGCVVLSTERMREIVEINGAERLAVVQPGVVNDDLRAAVAEHGLWYPPDPASAPWSTIGGNVATNAGGLCCVKYGVTRDYVLALEVVTAAGEVVRVGQAHRQGRRRVRPRRADGRVGGHARRDHRGHRAAAAAAHGRAAHGRRVLRHRSPQRVTRSRASRPAGCSPRRSS